MKKKKGRNDERVEVGGDGTRLLDKWRGSCLLPRAGIIYNVCDKKHNCVILVTLLSSVKTVLYSLFRCLFASN